MMRGPPDPSAIDGKFAPPEEHAQVLVVGAGPAGLAAALEAARAGASVVLVDENPVEPGLMGLDVPYLFGGRYTAEVQRPARLLAQIANRPEFEQAMEAGVDLRLGVTAWGLYVGSRMMQGLPGDMVGLTDGERSWMCGFDTLILAAGARDIALAFPGWDQPGVIGARALRTLVAEYDAFSGRRIAILGSGDLAVRTALMAADKGLDVAGLVEIGPQALASAQALQELSAAGIPVMTGAQIRGATGGPDGVTALGIIDAAGRAADLACDTVCVAVGLAPAIELLDASHGQTAPQPRLGGHAPVLIGWKTSHPGVFVAGDAAGLTPDSETAALQGRQAARQALGLETEGAPSPGPDAWAVQTAWHAALTRHAGPDLIVCQCEAVTRADLLEVRAPRYLGDPTPAAKDRPLTRLIEDGPANPDQIKRLTRAGMGPCQGRRCREQVALTLAEAAGAGVETIPLAQHRAPVRPLPLSVIADWQETAAMSAGWEIWFAIPGQWTPYADIGTPRETERAGWGS